MLRRGAGLLGELLVTLGVLLLLFVGWQLWWTDVAAGREQSGTVQALERGFDAASGGRVGSSAQHLQPAPEEAPATLRDLPLGQAFAVIRVPRFGADYARPILEGTDEQRLTEGVGHYVGTAMPGQVGNFALAGHRTTYGKPFSDIDRLQTGDVVVIETSTDYFVYTVQRHVVVGPDRVDVVAPVPERPGVAPTQRWLTMTACHPRFSAAQRYVTFASLERTIPRAQGLPASVLRVPGKAA